MIIPIIGSHRPDRATKAGHVYCSDRRDEIPECECLECPKFKVWHRRDESRCYYEYKELKSKGYYLRISIPRLPIKKPRLRRRGGRRVDLSGPGISGENYTAQNAEAKELTEQELLEYQQPNELELEIKEIESRQTLNNLSQTRPQSQEQELDIENEWLDLLNDIASLAPLEQPDMINSSVYEIDLDQNLQNPLSPLGTVDLDPGPIY